jgi:hypothetical protein
LRATPKAGKSNCCARLHDGESQNAQTLPDNDSAGEQTWLAAQTSFKNTRGEKTPACLTEWLSGSGGAGETPLHNRATLAKRCGRERQSRCPLEPVLACACYARLLTFSHKYLFLQLVAVITNWLIHH